MGKVLGMFIDFRNRPPVSEFLQYFQPERTLALMKKFGGRSLPASYTGQSMALWRTELTTAGIGRVVVFGRSSPSIQQGPLLFPESRISNEWLAELCRDNADVLVGFGAIDLRQTMPEAVHEVRHCLEGLGLKGIFLEPQRAWNAKADDHRLNPIYDECERRGCPILIMSGPNAGNEIEMTSPAAIDRVANLFPNLRILCGHGCWPYVREIIAVAFKHPNVYVSPDVYTFMPGGELYVEAANLFMGDQLLFGTCYPILDMEEAVTRYRNLAWQDDRTFQKVMSLNAQRLLE